MMSNASSNIHKEPKLGEFTMDLYDDEALIKELQREQKRQKRLEAKRLAEEKSLRERKKANASRDLHKEQKLGEFTMDLYDDKALLKELDREQKNQECLEVKRLAEGKSLQEKKENGSRDIQLKQKLGEFTMDLYDEEALIKELEREQKGQECLEATKLAEDESAREIKEKTHASSNIHKQKLEEYTTDLYDSKVLIKELEKEQKRQERLEAKRLAEQERLEAKKLAEQKRLEAKRLAEEESLRERKEKALKGMRYLLGLSEQYTTFFRQKVFSNTEK